MENTHTHYYFIIIISVKFSFHFNWQNYYLTRHSILCTRLEWLDENFICESNFVAFSTFQWICAIPYWTEFFFFFLSNHIDRAYWINFFPTISSINIFNLYKINIHTVHGESTGPCHFLHYLSLTPSILFD